MRFVRTRLRYLLPFVALLVVIAAVGFAQAEDGGSFGDGLWWALSLVTTVGFVGHAPVTVGGRILAGLLMVVGFALMAMTTASIASLFVRDDEAPRDARDRDFERQLLEQLDTLNARLERIERSAAPAADQHR